MKKIIVLLCGLSIFACKDKTDTKPLVLKNAVENTGGNYSSKLGGRSENMIDQIYNEILKTDKNLESFDKKIKNLLAESVKAGNADSESINKSKSYYATANAETKLIKDSLLKKETLEFVKISENKFKERIQKFEKLKLQISENSIKINDQYLAFKIRKTLPELEEYQNSHPVQLNSLNAFIHQQNNLLTEFKNFK